eukprot:1151369-Rhodomonas_salina.3
MSQRSIPAQQEACEVMLHSAGLGRRSWLGATWVTKHSIQSLPSWHCEICTGGSGFEEFSRRAPTSELMGARGPGTISMLSVSGIEIAAQGEVQSTKQQIANAL